MLDIILDKDIEMVKNCILKTQGGDKINWTNASKDIGIPKTTLWQIFAEGRSPTWKNLSKILEYTGCHLVCDSKKRTVSSKGTIAKGKGKR